MIMDEQRLIKAIGDLIDIDNAGMLTELYAAFRADCRAAGTSVPSDRNCAVRTMNAGAIAKAGDIAFAASQILGIPEKEAERVAIKKLVVDPWREIGLETIADYVARLEKPAPQPNSESPQGRRRAW
jgi:hypothetical protein